MVNLKRNYHVVSIIGSQSSGKSTLLNELFNTSFEVLDKRKRVGQTTKGIWFSVDAENKMFIFDVEGSDSNERMDTRTVLLFLFRKPKGAIPYLLLLRATLC